MRLFPPPDAANAVAESAPVHGAAGGRWNNEAMSEQPGRYQRSFRGMVGAMVVLLGVVALFVTFRDLNRNDPADPVKSVDYRSPARFAREEARFPLLAPRRLPEGWIATSVRFENVRDQAWHVGFLTDDRRYVGLEQADESAGTMVEEFVGEDAQQGEDVTVAGVAWETWTAPDDDRALVREQPAVTTLVVGPVPQATLEDFIATLE